MRDKLVARGIPSEEVAFTQDYDGDEAKWVCSAMCAQAKSEFCLAAL